MKNNRTYKITTRLNFSEYEKLLNLSKSSGILKSEFIRTAIFNVQINAKLTEEERRILRTLIGVATNLNQLAYKANAKIDFLTIAIELQNTRRNIDDIINKLNNHGL